MKIFVYVDIYHTFKANILVGEPITGLYSSIDRLRSLGGGHNFPPEFQASLSSIPPWSWQVKCCYKFHQIHYFIKTLNSTSKACFIPGLNLRFGEGGGGGQCVRLYIPSANTTGTNITSLELISSFLHIRSDVLSATSMYTRWRMQITSTLQRKYSIYLLIKRMGRMLSFQQVLTMIHNDAAASSKTINTPHHNCLFFFMISTIFYQLGPVRRTGLSGQAKKTNLTNK